MLIDFVALRPDDKEPRKIAVLEGESSHLVGVENEYAQCQVKNDGTCDNPFYEASCNEGNVPIYETIHAAAQHGLSCSLGSTLSCEASSASAIPTYATVQTAKRKQEQGNAPILNPMYGSSADLNSALEKSGTYLGSFSDTHKLPHSVDTKSKNEEAPTSMPVLNPLYEGTASPDYETIATKGNKDSMTLVLHPVPLARGELSEARGSSNALTIDSETIRAICESSHPSTTASKEDTHTAVPIPNPLYESATSPEYEIMQLGNSTVLDTNCPPPSNH